MPASDRETRPWATTGTAFPSSVLSERIDELETSLPDESERPIGIMSQSYDRGLIEDYGRWQEFSAGMWAWIFHKFTGWVLVGYLFMHIAVLSTATVGAETYSATISGLEGLVIIRVLEVGLLAVAVFHILNGVRLLFIDLGVGLESQEQTFYVALVATGLIAVASVPTFLTGVF